MTCKSSSVPYNSRNWCYENIAQEFKSMINHVLAARITSIVANGSHEMFKGDEFPDSRGDVIRPQLLASSCFHCCEPRLPVMAPCKLVNFFALNQNFRCFFDLWNYTGKLFILLLYHFCTNYQMFIGLTSNILASASNIFSLSFATAFSIWQISMASPVKRNCSISVFNRVHSTSFCWTAFVTAQDRLLGREKNPQFQLLVI